MPPKVEEEKPGGSFVYGACSFVSFPNPTFKNVSRKNLIDILVELRTNTGDLVPFVGVGRTIVTLSFRRKL